MTSRSWSNNLALGLGIRTARFSLDAFVIFNILLAFDLNCSGREGKAKIPSPHEGQYHIFLDAQSLLLGHSSARRMKKAIWILVTCVVVLGTGYWGLRSYGRRFWESTLNGPFSGAPFVGSITTAPVSVLVIPAKGRLEVHALSPPTNPVVVFRASRGTIEWSRLFVPERKRDGQIEYVGLRDLRLHRWERRSTGSVVVISCDWDWGGKEGGLIDLDGEYGFKSFRLSW